MEKYLPGSTTYSLGLTHFPSALRSISDEIVTKCTFQLCWVESVESTYMQLLVYNVDSLHTCTLHTWSFKNYVKACSVPLAARSHRRGIWLSLLSLSVCYRLQYMLRCTLRATLVTRGRVAFLYGSSRGAPICNILYLPFIVVQLTLNSTINP